MNSGPTFQIGLNAIESLALAFRHSLFLVYPVHICSRTRVYPDNIACLDKGRNVCRKTIVQRCSLVLSAYSISPGCYVCIDHFKLHKGRYADIKRAIATATEIKDAIDQYYSVGDSLSHIIGPRRDEHAPTVETISSLTDPQSETPIIKLVNLIIAKAVKEKASDIHIEPEETRLRIRYRVDSLGDSKPSGERRRVRATDTRPNPLNSVTDAGFRVRCAPDEVRIGREGRV